jgi:hypothetical protein
MLLFICKEYHKVLWPNANFPNPAADLKCQLTTDISTCSLTLSKPQFESSAQAELAFITKGREVSFGSSEYFLVANKVYSCSIVSSSFVDC